MKNILLVLMLFLSFNIQAENYHHNYGLTPNTIEVPVVLNTTEVTTMNEITEYSYNDCQGIAIAQAGSNNQMYLGTHKPQVSIGVGECNGEVAGSLMFGIKPCNNCPLINGSWAMDEKVNAFGIGGTFIFK